MTLLQQNDWDQWDDAMHILCPVCTVMTLCNKSPEGRNVVPADQAPDHDEGSAWCWTCLQRKPEVKCEPTAAASR